MSQLIALTVKSRQPVHGDVVDINASYGLDPNDIVVPIRRGGGTFFDNGAPTSRSVIVAQLRKDQALSNRQAAKVEYIVDHSLATIQAMSELFFLGTVVYRRTLDNTIAGEATTPKVLSEPMVFVASRIHGEMIPYPDPNDPTTVWTKFFYEEDTDPQPVEYIVSETIAAIVAQTV